MPILYSIFFIFDPNFPSFINLQQNSYKITSNTDFRNKSALDPCSINMSVICFIWFVPKSDPTFKQSEDRGMRIMVESDNDHRSF